MIYVRSFVFGLGGAIIAAVLWIVVAFVLPMVVPYVIGRLRGTGGVTTGHEWTHNFIANEPDSASITYANQNLSGGLDRRADESVPSPRRGTWSLDGDVGPESSRYRDLADRIALHARSGAS